MRLGARLCVLVVNDPFLCWHGGCQKFESLVSVVSLLARVSRKDPCLVFGVGFSLS